MSEAARLTIVVGVFGCLLIGWGAAGYPGGAVGLAVGLALLAVPWGGRQVWSWAALYLRRQRVFELVEPVTVVNDRTGGGVRHQQRVAVAVVQLLGLGYQPTYLGGSTAIRTANTLDIGDLFPLMRQSLGLTVESISIVSSGSRRRATGDYPRVYDTLIGTPPYAGRRETWLVLRIRESDNADALRCRPSIGAAALAAAQRVAASLRGDGIRARVGTATDIVELERRLGSSALAPANRRWGSVRGDAGWQTTYAYRPADISTENLARAWSLRVDGVVQNITLYPDGTASAALTVRTPKPPQSPPATLLAPLPGQQAAALAATMCCPRPRLTGLRRGPLPQPATIAIGASGVLLGKTAGGERVLLPLSDPGEHSRVQICAEDAIAKRIIIRAAAAGERVTVHTAQLDRWASVRMPHVAVVEHPRPAAGTTISVTDGTVPPAPRPGTVISVAPVGTGTRSDSDVVIAQTGPGTVAVTAPGLQFDVEVEYFRVENHYTAAELPEWDVEPKLAVLGMGE